MSDSSTVSSADAWPMLATQALDALASRIAVVNRRGVIVRVNLAWREFARAHGASESTTCEGSNLFDVCRSVPDGCGSGTACAVADALARVLDGSLPQFEAEDACELGTGVVWVGTRITPIRTGANALALVVYDDITRRKHTETALAEAERSFERAQAMAAVGSWTIDLVKGTFTASQHAMRVAGWEAGCRPVAEFVDRIHPDDKELQRTAWVQALKGAPYDLQHRIICASGVRWVRVKAEIACGPDGRAVKAFGMIQDITEMRSALDELAEHRTRLRTLLNTIPDLVFVKDPGGRYIGGNRAVLDFLGVSEEQFLGRTDFDFFAHEAAEVFRRDDELAMKRGEALRLEESAASPRTGEHVSIETIKTPMFVDGRLVGVLGIARDVTSQRRTDAALIQSEQLKQFALDAAELGTWHAEPGKPISRFDERARRLWDVDEEEVDIHAMLESRVHPEDRARLAPRRVEDVEPQKPGAQTARSGERDALTRGPGSAASREHATREFRVRHRDGSEHWLLAHVQPQPLVDANGQLVTAVHGTFQDITERKRAEEMVTRFVAASPVLLYALGIAGEHIFVRWISHNVEALTGWSHDDGLDEHWWQDNLHPDDRDRVLTANTLPIPGDHLIQEYRFRKANGTYIWIRDEKRVLRDSSHQPTEIVGSLSDVTQRVALEEQLRQAHKLEAIGLLAGGIAHDFNNLLTVIGGNCDLLSRSPGLPAAAPPLLKEIHDAGERASALTRQLLAFSRSQVLAPRVASLNTLVSQLASMLARLIGEDIRFECELAEDAGYVLVDASQFEQVVLNMAVNARDAMPDGGRLTLRTGSIVLDETYTRLHPDVAPGAYATLTVSDTGAGMAPELMDRIFEPFFTTKGSGRGTGLGLSMAFGIIKQSGGHIDVESRLKEGSTFRIYLPQVEPVSSSTSTARSDAAHAGRGNETVLLAEDEDVVGRLVRVGLEQIGYRVLFGANGREALDVADSHEGPIDLLLSDVVMPEMHGPQLAHELSKRRPGLKVLFMSGYVHDGDERHGVAESHFLAKPFSLKQLSDKVREVLDVQ